MTIGRVGKHHRGLQFSWKSVFKFLAFAMVISVLIPELTKINTTEHFPISDVKVYGARQTDHQDLQSLVAPFVTKSFFSVDLSVIKERIMRLPWISEVTVKREWPGQISIAIKEKEAMALWNESGLVSTTGEVFSPPLTTYPEHLPQFIGPTGEQVNMMKYYEKMNNLLLPLHFKIARLELSNAMTWNVVLDNGIKINVGYKHILTRISHFVKVYPKIVGDREANVEYIDLRYPNGLAVRWKSLT